MAPIPPTSETAGPPPAPEAAAIVIFGAAVGPDGQPSTTLRRRVEAAYAFSARLDRALFVPTGARGRYGEAESHVMARLLGELGVPADRIAEEPTGTDTLSSAIACAALLRRLRHRGPVFAATSAYHLRRCVLLLRLAGVAARAAPPPPWPAARSWRKRWFWRLREIPAIPYDAVLMLWHRLRRGG